MNAEKIDLFKLHKQDYVAPETPALVDIKPATYLSISGQGEPGGAVFLDKMGALKSVASTINAIRKSASQVDYVISPLESLMYGPNDTFLGAWTKNRWCWKLLIRTPDFVTPSNLSQAVAILCNKANCPAAQEVQLESLDEGLCVQMLHVGPFEAAARTVMLMENFAQKQSLMLIGRHHTIYISDPLRVAPEDLRIVIRVPVTHAVK